MDRKKESIWIKIIWKKKINLEFKVWGIVNSGFLYWFQKYHSLQFVDSIFKKTQ